MAKSVVLRSRLRVEPQAQDRDSAALLSIARYAQCGGETTVCFPSGTMVSLSPSLLKVLQFPLTHLPTGTW